MTDSAAAPRLFVASSREGLSVAYAVQQNLEQDAEIVVWPQGVFRPTSTTLSDLLAALPGFGFGLFVFHPDDSLIVRDASYVAVRDNVILELGLFLGSLGAERSFIVVPRGVEDLRWPSDLVGLRPLSYEPERSDQNLQAALGPACQEIRQAMKRLGPSCQALQHQAAPSFGEEDQIVVLAAWARTNEDRLGQLIVFADLDSELRLKPGSTKKYIKQVVPSSYEVLQEGPQTILFHWVSRGVSLRRSRGF